MRVVVSGVGLVTPLGVTRELTWKNILEGRTAIVKESHGLEAHVQNFSMNGAHSRTGDFAVMAASEALNHAGISSEFISTHEIGCAISQSKPILSGHAGPALNPTLLLSSFFGFSCESIVQKEFSLTGPTANIAAACATGVASIETGVHWIQTGQCDVALVGAAEASLHPFFRSGFEQMGVLAHGENASAARPFDKNRSGFVMGEGAAVLVLESESSAKKRNHKPLGSVLSVKLHHSSHDPLRFDPDGSSIGRLVKEVATSTAGVGYINAHGTGTLFNDVVESKGIRLGLGKSADNVAVSSTKAATGHLLGAAGAVEAAFAVLALRDQILPPTLHLTEADPDCDLDFVPHQARKKKIDSAMSLSYGFGGQMGAVLFGL